MDDEKKGLESSALKKSFHNNFLVLGRWWNHLATRLSPWDPWLSVPVSRQVWLLQKQVVIIEMLRFVFDNDSVQFFQPTYMVGKYLGKYPWLSSVNLWSLWVVNYSSRFPCSAFRSSRLAHKLSFRWLTSCFLTPSSWPVHGLLPISLLRTCVLRLSKFFCVVATSRFVISNSWESQLACVLIIFWASLYSWRRFSQL